MVLKLKISKTFYDMLIHFYRIFNTKCHVKVCRTITKKFLIEMINLKIKYTNKCHIIVKGILNEMSMF